MIFYPVAMPLRTELLVLCRLGSPWHCARDEEREQESGRVGT